MTISKDQQKAAEAVRSYMRSKHLGIEEDEVDASGVVHLGTSDRRSAGDDDPPPELVDSMRAHAKAIRALSPYAFAGIETIDEWVHLNVKVKNQIRKDKPETVDKLSELLKARFPDTISKHPQVLSIYHETPHGYGGRLQVKTSIEGRYDKRTITFGWALRGDTTAGWTLVVDWGVHSITRPATFKKLTPTIVLKQLYTLICALPAPLDALGWTINVRTPSGYVMTGNGKHAEDFGLWQVADNRTRLLKSSRSDATDVLFINNYERTTTLTVSIGLEVPKEVEPVKIIQSK